MVVLFVPTCYTVVGSTFAVGIIESFAVASIIAGTSFIVIQESMADWDLASPLEGIP